VDQSPDPAGDGTDEALLEVAADELADKVAALDQDAQKQGPGRWNRAAE